MSARTINSPGVEVNEYDLGVTAEVTAGHTVFVAGFADQGPTDEIVQLTGGISDFEDVFGKPTTAAERYFYHSVKTVAEQSTANILVSRLPYGQGGGEGFNAPAYGVLAYPVAPFNSTTYASALSTGILSTYTDPNCDFYFVGSPTYISLTEDQYVAIKSGDITWDNAPSTNLSGFDELGKSGFFILNKSQSTLNSKFEGYYFGLADNAATNPAEAENSIINIYTRTNETSSVISIPETRLNFSLSSSASSSTNSISSIVNSATNYDIYDDYSNDIINIGLFKIRKDILGVDPNVLVFSLAERHSVSFDAQRIINNSNGGQPISIFAEQINDTSVNLDIYVNPNISTVTGSWLDINNKPKKSVRIITNANKTNQYFIDQLGGNTSNPKADTLIEDLVLSGYGYADSLYPISVFSDFTTNDKNIGSIPAKLERVFDKLQDTKTYVIDSVLEAGLGTVWTVSSIDYPLSSDYRQYDDEKFFDIDELKITQNYTSEATPIKDAYLTIANMFVQLAGTQRKDCVYVADPLRQIFVQGKNLKTLSVKSNYFSRDIYWPIRHQFEGIDSNYTIVYANWSKRYDSASDKMVWVPFSPHAAVAFSGTPRVWNAPAGFDYGQVTTEDLAYYPNKKEQGQIYSLSINPVTFFTGQGFVIYGQRTKQSKPSPLRDINVRRLFLYFERLVANLVVYYVFQNNTFFTRNQIVNTLTPYFEEAKSSTNQGLYNYKIVCNESNNTSTVIDSNELVIDIALQPTRVAEYIIVNFYSTRTSQDINEILPG